MNLKDFKIFKDSKKGIISPINKSVVGAIEKFNKPYERALKKGEKTLRFPQWSIWSRCPNCGSIFYWGLFGGNHERRCAKCKTTYISRTGMGFLKKGVIPQNSFLRWR
ncbi:MAG: hypothetical protein WC906_05190 [Parcubacteria group bacterium]|jgi:hypothetical protein